MNPRTATRWRSRPWLRSCVGLGAGLLHSLACLQADQGAEGPSLTLVWENDAIRHSDRHFTQGGRILYLSSDGAPPDWVRRLSSRIPGLGFEAQGLKYGLELGQEIYTPEDLEAVEVIETDRPYAGWLYLGAILQRRGRGPAGIYVMEHLRIEVGVVGEAALAEQAQKVWHSRDPNGWDHQLKNEPGLLLRYDRNYLFRWQDWGRWNFDVLPGVDAALGNVDIHVGLRVTGKVGYHIPNRHEVPGRRTPKGYGAYMFATLSGKAVAHNIFLDGNTWQDSHRVGHEPFVAGLTAGVALVLGPVEVTAANHYVSHEFPGQDRSDSYGSVALGFKF